MTPKSESDLAHAEQLVQGCKTNTMSGLDEQHEFYGSLVMQERP